MRPAMTVRAWRSSEDQSDGSVSIEKRSDAHSYSQFAFKNKLASIKCVVVRIRWSIRFGDYRPSRVNLIRKRPNRSAQRHSLQRFNSSSEVVRATVVVIHDHKGAESPTCYSVNRW